MKLINIILNAMKNSAKEAQAKKDWERMVQSGVINVKEYNKKHLTSAN